jgi:hypothetical protein
VVRMIVEFVLAGVFLILALVTVLNPEWIETVFHIDPDRGSGALEWLIVAAFGILAVVSASLGTRTAVARNRAA